MHSDQLPIIKVTANMGVKLNLKDVSLSKADEKVY